MRKSRYKDLMENPLWTLSNDEIKEGWHICMDADGRPVHKDWPFMSKCGCPDLLPCQKKDK